MQGDGVVHPLSRFLVSIALSLRCTADGEGAVVARPVSDERVNDVEVRLITRADQPVRKIVRMRAAAFASNRVDGFDAV